MVSSLDGGASSSSHLGSASAASLETGMTSKLITKQIKCVVLDEENFFCWKAQFAALMRGYHLLDYVNGTMEISLGSLAEQQDQLILS